MNCYATGILCVVWCSHRLPIHHSELHRSVGGNGGRTPQQVKSMCPVWMKCLFVLHLCVGGGEGDRWEAVMCCRTPMSLPVNFVHTFALWRYPWYGNRGCVAMQEHMNQQLGNSHVCDAHYLWLHHILASVCGLHKYWFVFFHIYGSC